MRLETARQRTFSARLDCHYLLYAPEPVGTGALLVLALHGYGQNPASMLGLTAAMLGPKHVIAALEGPNRFFLSPKAEEVGYGWVTPAHAESSIRLHHEMVRHVFEEVGGEFAIPPARRLLVGFSQPVGMNYRFAATCPEAVRGVIGVCGGLPGNWEEGPYRECTAALLHLARRGDEFYPPEVTARYAERLRQRARDVEFHMLEGGHRFPSKAGPIVERWIARVF